MSDVATIVLAVAVVLGAAISHPIPLWLGAAGAVLALVARWPLLFVLGCALLASGLAARAEAGAAAMRPQRFSGWVTLLADPAPAPGGIEVVVRMGRRHVDLWAHGDAARAIDDFLAGERVEVAGVVRPVPERSRQRDAHRHVVGRLTVDSVLAAAPASPVNRAANWVHRTLGRGAQVLPLRARALYLGFVVGDRRGVDSETAARFEASGLTHLLAVSGENVAFVLAAASPLLRRLRLQGRALAAIGVILFFATVTRFEPSVLRARAAMAGLAAVAQASGRPTSGLRLLALATAGLVLVDPFLIWSVGFRLSVGRVARHPAARRAADAPLPGPTLVRRGPRRDIRRADRRRSRRDSSVRVGPARSAACQPARGAGGRAAHDVGPRRRAAGWVARRARRAAAPLADARGDQLGRRCRASLPRFRRSRSTLVSQSPRAHRDGGRRGLGAPAVATARFAAVEVDLGGSRFDITTRSLVMGILNRTPDSFFDQGGYSGSTTSCGRPSTS